MDNTNSSICKIFDDYLDNNKIANNKYVEDILDILLTNNKLTDLVNNIKYVNLKDSYACYNYKEKTIMFGLSTLCLNKTNPLEVGSNNLNILRYILHEFKHIKQFYEVLNSEDSLESKLLKYTIIGHEINKEKIRIQNNNIIDPDTINLDGFDYNFLKNIMTLDKIVTSKKGYNLSPAERIAEYYSYKTVGEILDESSYDISLNQDSLFTAAKLKDYLIHINSKIISPVERYLKLLNKNGVEGTEVLDEVLNSNLNLEDRLYYGLPITKTEYQKVKSSKHK